LTHLKVSIKQNFFSKGPPNIHAFFAKNGVMLGAQADFAEENYVHLRVSDALLINYLVLS